MPTAQLPGPARELAGKYLTFNLPGGAYGIDVLKVREIIRHANITSRPSVPLHILGVIK
jgi:chemotaxis signal transduction protein